MISKWADKIYSGLFWTLEYHYVPLLGLFPLFYFGTCLLGPMAALRYIYSLIVCVSFFAYIAISENK